MKRIRPGIFKKSFCLLIVLCSLLVAAGVEARAAIPEELILEVVIEPNHQPAVPCQINAQNQMNNPAEGGQSDHAAHHPSSNGSAVQPVPFTEAARLAAIKELNDSQNYLLKLMEIFESTP